MARHFEIIDFVYASYRPFEDLWQDRPTRIWVSMADKTLPEMMAIVIKAIRDQTTPKNILLMFFQKVIGATSVEIMRSYIEQIVTEVKAQNWNKCCISTCYFVPSHEPIWDRVGQFNRMAHKANEDMGVSKVNIHKALMSQVSDSDLTLRLRAPMFIEFQLGVHLGTHLSHEGVANVVRMVKTVLRTAFKYRTVRNINPRETRVVVPPSLAYTAGYNKNRFMRQLMADRGIIRPDRLSPGQRRLMMSDQRLSGWQNWYVFKQHGPLRRYQEREGMLEAIIMQLKTSDKIPVWNTDEEEVDETEDNNDGDDANNAGDDANNAVEDANNAVENEETQAVVNEGAYAVAKERSYAVASEEEAYDPDEWLPDDFEIEIINISDGEIEVHHRPVSQKQPDPEPEQVPGDDSGFEMFEVERRVSQLDLTDVDEFEMIEAEPVKARSDVEMLDAEKEKSEAKTEEDNDLVNVKEQLRESESKFAIAVAMITTYRDEIRTLKSDCKYWKKQFETKAERLEFLEDECERLTAQYEFVTYNQMPKGRKSFK